MKDRIRQIMENENLTPARFADKLQINRAVISHILTGRNNPSLDVVIKILAEMSYVNSDWLINGVGPMYKDGFDLNSLPQEKNLFSHTPINYTEGQDNDNELKENRVKIAQNSGHVIDNMINSTSKNSVRKITQIIIYYDDNTFEALTPK